MCIEAYYEREKRDDLRAGLLVSTLANVNKKKSARPFKPSDFFPSLKPRQRRQSAEQQRQALTAIALGSGASVRRVSREQLRLMRGEA